MAGSVSVGAYVALQECLQAVERNLAVLILDETVVGLQLLQPPTEGEQVLSVRESDLIRLGIQIARGTEIASCVCAAIGDLRCAVERGAATDDNCADGLAFPDPCRQIHDCAAIEKESAARETECRSIYYA